MDSSCSIGSSLLHHTPSDSDSAFESDSDLQTLQQLAIPLLLAILLIVETYFAFSRYYNVRSVTHSQCNASIPFLIYSLLFLFAFWCSIYWIPFLTPFLAIFHVVSNCYFSYYFYQTIRSSYLQVDSARFGIDKNTASAIASVRAISILSSLSSMVSALSWCSVVLCSMINCLPFTLPLNCLLLYGMFTKNRIFWMNVIRCNKYNVCTMVQAPCIPMKKRRASRKWIRHRQKSLFGRLQALSSNKRTKSSLNLWNKATRLTSNSTLGQGGGSGIKSSKSHFVHNSIAISPRDVIRDTRNIAIDMTLPVEEVRCIQRRHLLFCFVLFFVFYVQLIPFNPIHFCIGYRPR